MTTATTSLTEHGAIAEAIQPYIDGARSGKGDDMKPRLPRGARPSSVMSVPTCSPAPSSSSLPGTTRTVPRRNLQARIAGIDVNGTVATVRLELDNWTGSRFTDLFTLLKVDGEWKIMNKVFHLHPAAPVSLTEESGAAGFTRRYPPDWRKRQC